MKKTVSISTWLKSSSTILILRIHISDIILQIGTIGPQNLCEDFAIQLPTRQPGSVTCVTEELLGSGTRSCLQLLKLLG